MTLLFLNSIGTGEFIIIILAVLMLFGSKGLPDIVKNLGKGMREIKAASDEIRKDIQNSALEMRRDINMPTMDELTKNSELKEIENLVKIEDAVEVKSPDEKNTPKTSPESKSENSETTS